MTTAKESLLKCPHMNFTEHEGHIDDAVEGKLSATNMYKTLAER